MSRHVGRWPACTVCHGAGFHITRRWVIEDGEPTIRTVEVACTACRGDGFDQFA